MSGGTLALAFGIAWLLVGPHRAPAAAAREGCRGAGVRRSQPPHHGAHAATRSARWRTTSTAWRRRWSAGARRSHYAADEMRQAKDTLAAVIDASPVAIVCCDLDRNRSCSGAAPPSRCSAIPPRRRSAAAAKLVPAGGPARIARRCSSAPQRARPSGTSRSSAGARTARSIDVRLAAAPMYNPDGTVRGVACAYEDITDRKKAEEQLSRLAHYDPADRAAQPRSRCRRSWGACWRGRRHSADLDRAVRSRRLQGRQRHARSFDRRPAAGRGRRSA